MDEHPNKKQINTERIMVRLAEEKYPDIADYLEEALGVGAPELAELRARYLE